MDDDQFARALGERLRTARWRRGMTQAALADTAFSKSFVSQVEHGRIHPSLSSLQHFSERLGIRLSTLLGEPTESELAAHLTDLALELGMVEDAERLLGTLERSRREAHAAAGTKAAAGTDFDRAVTLRRGALALVRGDTRAASRLLQAAKREATDEGWSEGARTLLWEGRLALAQKRPLWAARAWEGCLQLCELGARRSRAPAERVGAPPAEGPARADEAIISHPPWDQPAPLRARALDQLARLHEMWGEERSGAPPAAADETDESRKAGEGGETTEKERPLPLDRGEEPLLALAKARVRSATEALDEFETRQAEYWAAQADAFLGAHAAQSAERPRDAATARPGRPPVSRPERR